MILQLKGLYENGSERFWEKFYRKLFWAEIFFQVFETRCDWLERTKETTSFDLCWWPKLLRKEKKSLGWKNESVMEADKLNLKSPVWSCLMFKKVSFAGPERQLTWLRFFCPKAYLVEPINAAWIRLIFPHSFSKCADTKQILKQQVLWKKFGSSWTWTKDHLFRS